MTTRSAILDSAEILFARQGYGSTSIKEIADLAGNNSALLYYYFRNKDGLYREVLERRFSALAAEALSALSPPVGPEEGLRRLVEVQTRHLASHPHLPALLVREMVDHQAQHAQQLIPHILGPLFARLTALIADGQRTGVFRSELDPRLSAISTIAQVVYVAIARPMLGLLMGMDAASMNAFLDVFGAHAATFSLSALRTPTRTR